MIHWGKEKQVRERFSDDALSNVSSPPLLYQIRTTASGHLRAIQSLPVTSLFSMNVAFIIICANLQTKKLPTL